MERPVHSRIARWDAWHLIRALRRGCWLLALSPTTVRAQVAAPTPNVRYAGGSELYAFNLPSASGEPAVPSASSCQLACQRNRNCSGYTFANAGVEGTAPRCHLKSVLGSSSTASGYASGIRTGTDIGVGVVFPPDYYPSSFKVQDGIDRPGTSYSTSLLTSTDVGVQTATCQQTCAGSSSCTFFTVTRPYSGPAQCNLKSGAPAPATGCFSCTAGIRIASTVPSTNFGFYSHPGFNATRPLLVVLVSYADRTSPFLASQNQAFYRQLVFGPAEPNLASYFYEASGGAYSFVEAGVISVTSPANPDHYGATKQLVAAAGFSFARFDNNQDGTISPDELSILSIDDGSFGGGQSGAPCTMTGVLNNCAYTSLAGHSSEFDNFAHELAHNLYQDEIFGARGFGTRQSMTATTGSAGGVNNPYISEYPEAYARMRWGWNPPLVVSTADRGACTRLEAQQSGRGNTALFFDPSRGQHEFYMAEFRSPAVSSFPSSTYVTADGTSSTVTTYEQSFRPSAGVLFWWIQTNSNGDPFERFVEIDPASAGTPLASGPPRLDDVLAGGVITAGPNGLLDTPKVAPDVLAEDMSIYTTFDPRIQSGRVGGYFNPGLLTGGTTPSVMWLDGRTSGIRVRTPRVTAGVSAADIEWGSVQMRIDSVAPSILDPFDTAFKLTGQFGVDDNAGDRKVILSGTSASGKAVSYQLVPTSWGCSSLSLTRGGVAPGSYLLRITAGGGLDSNAVSMTFE